MKRNEGGAAFVCLVEKHLGGEGGGGEGKRHDPLIRGAHRAIRTRADEQRGGRKI